MKALLRKLLDSELNRYIVSGFAAVLVDYTVLLIATEYFGIHYLISNICSYMSGLLVAYNLNIRWVFSYRKYGQETKMEFSIFVAIVVVGLVISEAIIYILVEELNLHLALAKLMSIGAIFMFNFLAKKRFLFTRSETQGD